MMQTSMHGMNLNLKFDKAGFLPQPMSFEKDLDNALFNRPECRIILPASGKEMFPTPMTGWNQCFSTLR